MSTLTGIQHFTKILQFICKFFKGHRSVRGTTDGQVVRPDTPCHDFFPADVDGIRINFAKKIDEKYGLEQFSFQWATSSVPDFAGLDQDRPAFLKKYQGEIGNPEFTLARYAEMVYDLIRIKNGLGVS